MAYFVFVQYIGQAFPNKDEVLGYFDKKTLQTIRVSPLLAEISKKLKVYFKIISQKLSIKPLLLFWVFPSEIEGLFTKKTIDVKKTEKELEGRKKYTLFLIRNGRENIYFGQKAKEIGLKELGGKQERLDVSKIHGQGTGKVKGRVKIVLGKKDFKKIQQGDILVVVTTMPYYLPVLKKAKGIIGEQGGLLSHTSIIARELGLPYIIGAKRATKILKDGNSVEMDAYKGIVKIIRKS